MLCAACWLPLFILVRVAVARYSRPQRAFAGPSLAASSSDHALIAQLKLWLNNFDLNIDQGVAIELLTKTKQVLSQMRRFLFVMFVSGQIVSKADELFRATNSELRAEDKQCIDELADAIAGKLRSRFENVAAPNDEVASVLEFFRQLASNLRAHASVRSLHFAENGYMLATCDQRGQCSSWDLRTLRRDEPSIHMPSGAQTNACCFDPAGCDAFEQTCSAEFDLLV